MVHYLVIVICLLYPGKAEKKEKKSSQSMFATCTDELKYYLPWVKNVHWIQYIFDLYHKIDSTLTKFFGEVLLFSYSYTVLSGTY